MGQTNPGIDAVLTKAAKWGAEMQALRQIVLTCPLTEDMKWGQPCYAHDGRNVVLIHGFKDYCALLFMKGALLKDPEGVLIQQTENVQSARQMRFTSLREISARKKTIKALVLEAIAVESAGLKVPKKKTEDFPVPAEFQKRLDRNAALRKAFAALTPGRQRAYLLYFAGAKQSATREARIEKSVPQILAGKGLND